MSLKAKIEAIIYAAEEPISVEQISLLVRDLVLAELPPVETPSTEGAEVEASALALTEAPEGNAGESPTDNVEAAAVADAPEVSGEPQAEAATVESETQVQSVAIEASEETPSTGTPAQEATKETPVEATADGQETSVAAAEPSDTQDTPAAPVEAVEDVPGNAEASVAAPDTKAKKTRKEKAPKKELTEDARVRIRIREIIQELAEDYDREDRGMEIRAVAGGYRMSTKPEHHDVVRAFAKSLKPPVRLSLAALETLAVIAYKQPITVPEISEIRGVESGGVIGTLLDRKLITTAGRKQVVGRPILYKTSKEFLLRFGLNGVNDLPSMEEFEKLASEGQGELFTPESKPQGDTNAAEASSQAPSEAPAEQAEAGTTEPQPTEASSPEAPTESESATSEEEHAQVQGTTAE